MGLTISGTVEMGSNNYSLGNVVAFVKATIDQSLLKGITLPNSPRITQSGSMVSFQGPVAIITSIDAFKGGVTILFGLGTAVALFFVVEKVSNFVAKLVIKAQNIKESDKKKKIATAEDVIWKVSLVASAALGLVSGIALFKYASFPTQPGVYFFDRHSILG